MDEVARAVEQIIAETSVPERTDEDRKRDALWQKMHEAAVAKAAAKKARGEKPPLQLVTERVLADITAKQQAAGIERVSPEEGDQPDYARVPANVLTELVPPRFAGVTFDTYTPKVQSQSFALRSAKRWVECARAGDGVMLALVGPTGNGKSHLLYAAANALLGAPPRYPLACYSRPWYKLANEIRYGGKSTFCPDQWSEASELRAVLWRQRVVLIDEVRPTAGTAFDDTELAMFACHAYDAKVSVLITSNVCPLENVMGAPAASRFSQVTMDGPDWRQL